MNKQYIITRKTLSFGQQAIQAGHALIELFIKYPKQIKEWHKNSNTLVYLSVANEDELYKMARLLEVKGIKFEEFKEPDFNNALTAIALVACNEATEFVKDLQSAFYPYDNNPLKNAEIFDREKTMRAKNKK